jgi:radical SAM superfamily enzyme YgiQ (UPF0313 family)
MAPYGDQEYHFGLGYLSAVLKQTSHSVHLIHIDPQLTREEYHSRLLQTQPELVGFSSTSTHFCHVKGLAQWTKDIFPGPVICGGVHATVAPEDAIATTGIDMICRGEAEYALLELCNALEQNRSYDSIHNLWIKKSCGQIIRNPVRPLIEDLDVLPDPDRSIFKLENLKFFRVFRGVLVSASRGCPFRCAYCCNHAIRRIYPNKQGYLRFRSVDRMLGELRNLLENHPAIQTFIFSDDILVIKKDWAEEFLERYRLEIGIPFFCFARPDLLTRKMAHLLKEAGCTVAMMGIQCGNERIRREILQRPVHTQRIIDGFALLHETGVATKGESIIGLPFEEKPDVLETIKLNARIKPHVVARFYFQPFPGTDLHRLALKHNWLKGTIGQDLGDGPHLDLPNISEEELKFLFRYFIVVVQMYAALVDRFPAGEAMLDALFTWDHLPFKLLNRLYETRIFPDSLKRNYQQAEMPSLVLAGLLFVVLPFGAILLLGQKLRGHIRRQELHIDHDQ